MTQMNQDNTPLSVEELRELWDNCQNGVPPEIAPQMIARLIASIEARVGSREKIGKVTAIRLLGRFGDEQNLDLLSKIKDTCTTRDSDVFLAAIQAMDTIKNRTPTSQK